MKKLLTLTLTSLLTVTSATTAFAQTFTDVPTNHWAYKAIEQTASNGVVNGAGNGKFNPNDTVTYGQWNKMICNIFWTGLEREPYRTDKWWFNDNAWVLEAHFYDNTNYRTKNASPTDYTDADANCQINRYEMAQVIYNIGNHVSAKKYFFSLDVDTTGVASQIADYQSIPPQYRDAVEYCYASGIITGVDDKGTFAGNQTMTRASSAVVLSRLMDAKAGKWVVPKTTTTASVTTPTTTVTPVVNNTNTNSTVSSPTAVKDMIKVTDYDTFKGITVTNKYIPGKLANGKDITPENIDSMFAEIEAIFPDGTSWGDGTNGGQDYNYVPSNPSPNGGGCNAYAGMVADTIFGHGAKWTKVADMNQMKKGDIIIEKNAQGVMTHVVVVTNVYTIDGITCYNYTDGNNNAKVNWDGVCSISTLSTLAPKSELYTAY